MRKLRLFLAALILSVSSVFPLATSLVHATPNTCTWTGATNTNFNTAGNWSNCGGVVPANGDSLIFDNTSLSASATLTNDITNLSVANITFQGNNSNFSSFTLTGNALTVTSGISVTSTQAIAEISGDLVLGGNVALSATDGLYISGNISGTGNLTTSGAIIALSGNNTFTGTVTATAGSLNAGTMTAFGTSSNAVTINDGADLSIGGCSDTTATFPYPLTLTGQSSNPTGAFPSSKLSTGSACGGGGGGADETYEQAATTDQSYTLSGAITLGSDVVFGAFAKTTTLTGALSGAHSFTLPNNWGGQLVINSSNNTASQANGTYNPAPITQTLSDSQPSHTVFIGKNATITITGTRGDTEVGSGGTLKGSGTVGALSIDTGGTVAPGDAPACLSSGNLTLKGTFSPELDGTTACSGYDQLKVTGTVTLAGSTLTPTIVSGFKPSAGQSFEIINNDGSDAVTGTFTGLSEGSTTTVNGYVFKISYKGGDGNDVVLSVVTVPAAPNTGFGVITAHPGVVLATTALGAVTILGVARRTRKPVRASRR